MTQPGHNFGDRVGFAAGGQIGALDHDDGYGKRAGGFELGDGAVAACVFCHQQFNLVMTQQVCVVRCCERPARDDDGVVRQRRRGIGRVYEAKDVVVLGGFGEFSQMHASDRKQNAGSGPVDRVHGGCHVRHTLPVVAWLLLPRRPGERNHRYASQCTGGYGVAAHLSGKRVRGVDNMRDTVCSDVAFQTGYAAEAADAMFDRLGARATDPAGIRQRCPQAGGGDGVCKGARFAGAAEDQEIVVHDA